MITTAVWRKLPYANLCSSLAIRTLRTNAAAPLLGINKYTTPTREIILSNEEIKRAIDLRNRLSDVQDPAKDKVFKYFNNRNPRHMELMGYNKPAGFTTLYESRNFYNKLNLELTNHHTKAYVENINGEILCYASTTEYYIGKELHSCTDVMAVVNIARILAERLKQIGVLRINWVTRQDRTTEKIREFEGILNNSGITLSEFPLKVLQGPSQTLPPPRPKRTFPGPKNRGWKRRGTIMRKRPIEDYE